LNVVGNRNDVIDPLGDFTQYGFNQDNDNYEVIDPRGDLTYEVLYATEQVHALHDADNNITTYTLDKLDRVTNTTTPLGTSTVAYDAASRVTSSTDADGRKILYSYDNADRLTGEVWLNTSGVTVNVVTYTYDNNGNLLTAADTNGTVTYSYDALDRVTSYTNVFGQVLTYSYDANDNLTQRTDSLGGTITYQYDVAGRLNEMQYSGTATTATTVYVDFGYNNRNDQTSIHSYGSGGVGVFSTYTFDAGDRLTSIVNSNSSGATLSYYTYTYDTADRVINQTYWSQIGTFTYSGTDTYTYDKASELLTDGTATLSYDSNGNRQLWGYQTGSDNRMTNDGTWTYTYDAVGNLIEKTRTTGQTWTYTYDNANELTGITETSGGPVLLRVTYTYDVTGHLVQEQVLVYGYSTTTTRYAYDGDTLWAQLDGSNNLEDRYLYEPYTGQILVSIAPSGGGGDVLAYFTDAEGSVRDLASLSGAVEGHFDYSGYGVVTLTAGSASSDLGYDGYRTDVSVGLDFTENRVYNPSTGTWLTQDPIGFAGGQANLSEYVGDNPTNEIDPSGLGGVVGGGGFQGQIGQTGDTAWAKLPKIPAGFKMPPPPPGYKPPSIFAEEPKHPYWSAFGEGLGIGADNIANGFVDTEVEVINIASDVWDTLWSYTTGEDVRPLQSNTFRGADQASYDGDLASYSAGYAGNFAAKVRPRNSQVQ
jgi:RHS repeat-associated protein